MVHLAAAAAMGDQLCMLDWSSMGDSCTHNRGCVGIDDHTGQDPRFHMHRMHPCVSCDALHIRNGLPTFRIDNRHRSHQSLDHMQLISNHCLGHSTKQLPWSEVDSGRRFLRSQEEH